MIDRNEELKGEVIDTAVAGRVRLEHYKETGYIVTFRGNNEIFWVAFEDLEKAVHNFAEIVNIRKKKPDGKAKITSGKRKK